MRFEKLRVDGDWCLARAGGTSVQRTFGAWTKPVLVERCFAALGVEKRIDLLGGQAAIRRVEERSGRALHAVVDQKLIHGVVASTVPSPADASARTIEMQKRAVQRLVGEHEL